MTALLITVMEPGSITPWLNVWLKTLDRPMQLWNVIGPSAKVLENTACKIIMQLFKVLVPVPLWKNILASCQL